MLSIFTNAHIPMPLERRLPASGREGFDHVAPALQHGHAAREDKYSGDQCSSARKLLLF